ncbi:hypothetical protein [Streptomyces fuscichromogenes]|uniref:Uncharacterized protein n=1 Tax=Streptomyces fuscichromogenes TaxID=1324013 RepID=A0A917X6F6_9ACTN|nr:hypothetical protein [Streptomyces fuscichromogenes]GGM86626.1 hypothetical protein GCM10011578_001790 [Streptomyces fuscichromogenes]
MLCATWTLLTRPEGGTRRRTRSGSFGREITVPVADRTHTLGSSRFTRI